MKRQQGKRQRLRKRVFERDKGICALCAMDAEEMGRRIQRAVESGILVSQLAKDLDLPPHWILKPFWDADHIVPLVEGGKDSLSNLRTLCLLCHREETRHLNKRLARIPEKVLFQKWVQGAWVTTS